MPATSVNNERAIWKSLQPLLDFAKDTVVLEFTSCVIEYIPPIRAGLSPTLWRKDDCKKCGRSCQGFALGFLPGEIIPPSIKGNVEKIDLIINGKEHMFNLYRQRHVRGDRGCDLLKGSIGKINSCSCSVHLYKPLHCWFPHMRVLHNQRQSYAILARTQYGRNWALGCPVNFEFNVDPIQVAKDREKLSRLNILSEKLGIPSRIPSLISAHKAQGLQVPKKVIYV